MVQDHGNSRGSGGNIDRSALLPNYSPVATECRIFLAPISCERFTKRKPVYPSVEAPASEGRSKPMKHNRWRPFTLRPLTLLFFLLFTISLITTIESLNHISTRNGALTFADPKRGFSIAQIFCYRYLPQMVIVLYGIGWAAVDLDVKRLEPYFQLSKPGGASASDSILLHYPFDFLALVPVTAAKRKCVLPASRSDICMLT